MRLGALFVAACMTVIAASAGVVVYFAYGFTGAEAIIVAIAALTALALYNAVSTRVNIRSVVGPQLAELSRSGADIARQLAETGRRLAAVEAKLERSLAKGEAATEPLAFEISELGALVDQLAESVAIHESRLTDVERSRREPQQPLRPVATRLEPLKPEPLRPFLPNPEPPRSVSFDPEPAGFEPPKPEAPRLEAPRPELPKAEPPKAESPRPEPLKPEPPKSEPPKSEPPKAEVLKALLTDLRRAQPAKSEPPRTELLRPEPKASVPEGFAQPAAAVSVAASTAGRAASELAIAGEQAPAPIQFAAPLAPSPTVIPLPAAAPAIPIASAITARERLGADSAVSREMLAAVRSAIEANRIDLHLQPIVTLPQRKVRFYEAMSRLRTQSGDVVMAAEFISQAEAGGLMPKIDNLVVFRCVQVLRRLLLKNREVGVFCNLSVATLTDAVVFPQLLEFLDANRAIAPSLVLEFTQGGLRGAGPIETESLAALRACGYHFSLDNVTDMRLEPRELAGRGFRFVKVRAGLILNRGGVSADIHPGDLPDLLGRYGIDLIAEKIESEGTVVDLLDYDVKFGQGFLFSPPRPVRAEALQGIGDQNDMVARDNTAAATGKATKGAGNGPEANKGLRAAGLTRVVARRI
ncbi:MAG TPA: EAL domain-containing protein [Xanthobacteraceae bacterium]